MKQFKKLAMLGVLAGAFSLAVAGGASAHIVVAPDKAPIDSFQTFALTVLNEKHTAFNKVKVLMPAGLHEVSPDAQPGWKIDVEKEGSGEDTIVKSVTWSGYSVPEGFQSRFTFEAQVPDKPGELQWKVYQTYETGETISWDSADVEKSPHDDSPDAKEDKGPFVVTKVVDPAATPSATMTDPDSKKTADLALYISIAAVALSLVGVYGVVRGYKSSKQL